MKANLPQPVHESYLKHRKEVRWKIIAPVAISAAICIACSALIYVATFNYNGNVTTWADISTIYLSMIAMIFLVIFFIMVTGVVFLLTRLLAILPSYTFMVQDFFYRIKSIARRASDSLARPIIFIDSIGASISRMFGKR